MADTKVDCPAVANLKGEHLPCQNNYVHTVHGNSDAGLIWADDKGNLSGITPYEPVRVYEPQVAIQDGEIATMWTDSFDGSATHGHALPPIKRAVYIARLRALADEIEKSGRPVRSEDSLA